MDKIEIAKHFNKIADKYDYYKKRNSYYYNEVNRFICNIIPPGRKVLEIGCASGNLLNLTRPFLGVGIDISENMIEMAGKKYPDLKFICTDLDNLHIDERFDYIIMSNLIDYVEDIWSIFKDIRRFVNEDTKIIIVTINPLWEPLMRVGTKLGLRTPDVVRNFVTNNDIDNILKILDFDIIEKGYRLIIPKKIPFLSSIANKTIAKLPIINNLCFMQYLIAMPKLQNINRKLSCSVIIPCFNEEDNIENCIRRVPNMGSFTEIIVVDDGSTDKTAEIVKRISGGNENVKLVSYSSNKGKGFAVKSGFDAAKGDVIMILDADMAVEPEMLPRFFSSIEEGKAEFVNGTRMIYPMEKKAMKMLNYLGNKMFGILISLIIGQRNTDTLCGTKALLKKRYLDMKMGWCPWGDFDLIFEAAKLKLKMVEMPVPYKKRVAGSSKMKAFKHGWQLLKVCKKGLNEIP